MSDAARCDLCGVEVVPGGYYVVRMAVFADPGIQMVEMGEGAEDEMEKLIEQMKGMSAEDLMDQVYREMEFKLCGRCQRKFVANPLGRPRGVVLAGEN